MEKSPSIDELLKICWRWFVFSPWEINPLRLGNRCREHVWFFGGFLKEIHCQSTWWCSGGSGGSDAKKSPVWYPMTDPAGAGILMLTWLGYMDGIHVTIYSSTMDPMGIYIYTHLRLWTLWFSYEAYEWPWLRNRLIGGTYHIVRPTF